MPVHDPGRAAPAWLTAGDTHDEVLGLLKSGKEAEVFVVERCTLDGGHRTLLAHKRHRPMEVTKGVLEAEGFSRARTFTTDAVYQAGRGFRVARDRRAVQRRSAHGRRVVAERWARDEYDSMVRAHAAGVTVPYPVEFTGDGTLMQFVGDDGVAAPRLATARLTAPELAAAHAQIVGDLSALDPGGPRPRGPVAVQPVVVAGARVVDRLPPGGGPRPQPARVRPAAPRRVERVRLVRPAGRGVRPRGDLRRAAGRGVVTDPVRRGRAPAAPGRGGRSPSRPGRPTGGP